MWYAPAVTAWGPLVAAQVPETHVRPPTQALPQVPQLAGSVNVSTHTLLHIESPLGHWQAPVVARHTSSPTQAWRVPHWPAALQTSYELDPTHPVAPGEHAPAIASPAEASPPPDEASLPMNASGAEVASTGPLSWTTEARRSRPPRSSHPAGARTRRASSWSTRRSALRRRRSRASLHRRTRRVPRRRLRRSRPESRSRHPGSARRRHRLRLRLR